MWVRALACAVVLMAAVATFFLKYISSEKANSLAIEEISLKPVSATTTSDSTAKKKNYFVNEGGDLNIHRKDDYLDPRDDVHAIIDTLLRENFDIRSLDLKMLDFIENLPIENAEKAQLLWEAVHTPGLTFDAIRYLIDHISMLQSISVLDDLINAHYQFDDESVQSSLIQAARESLQDSASDNEDFTNVRNHLKNIISDSTSDRVRDSAAISYALISPVDEVMSTMSDHSAVNGGTISRDVATMSVLEAMVGENSSQNELLPKILENSGDGDEEYSKDEIIAFIYRVAESEEGAKIIDNQALRDKLSNYLDANIKTVNYGNSLGGASNELEHYFVLNMASAKMRYGSGAYQHLINASLDRQDVDLAVALLLFSNVYEMHASSEVCSSVRDGLQEEFDRNTGPAGKHMALQLSLDQMEGIQCL